jgi:hypothetical protein
MWIQVLFGFLNPHQQGANFVLFSLGGYFVDGSCTNIRLLCLIYMSSVNQYNIEL